MATTMPGLFMVEANVGNCGLLACTKKSWANKVRETANGIAKCARNSFTTPLPTDRDRPGVPRPPPGRGDKPCPEGVASKPDAAPGKQEQGKG